MTLAHRTHLTLVGTLGLMACVTDTGPTPPKQPSTGPGGSEYVEAEMKTSDVGAGPTMVRVYEPASIPAGTQLPLVVLLHGYQATSANYYLDWVKHLVRHKGPASPNGVVVLAPVYQETATPPMDFAFNARAGLDAGVADLQGRGISINLDQVMFVGHSGGGALSVNLAAQWKQGRSKLRPRALVLVAPGRCLGCNQLEDPGIPMEPLQDVPSDLKMAVLNSHDDDAVGRALGRTIFSGLSQVAREQRTYLEFQSDYLGTPALLANHRVAAANPDPPTADFVTDALDFHGTWKIADAMLACTFAQQLCDVALGEGSAQRSMGQWSDGTPVAPMTGIP